MTPDETGPEDCIDRGRRQARRPREANSKKRTKVNRIERIAPLTQHSAAFHSAESTGQSRVWQILNFAAHNDTWQSNGRRMQHARYQPANDAGFRARRDWIAADRARLLRK
ncbi:hypothetical protein ABW21_db0203477 [Orbilia brochopaga]|nr:hypothetical protein ABW21_db0203477 [Drechslerella brochopaga]